MKLRTWVIALVGALAFGLMGSSAQAAPLGSIGDVRTNATQNSDVRDVRWRERCWWHRGHYHCRRHWHEDHGYYYDGGPYFYGPGIGFFFGGGGHGHHFHRHHGGRHHHHHRHHRRHHR